MDTSIIQALRNENAGRNRTAEMLNNAVTLLDKGYDKYTLIEPLLSMWGTVDRVPGIDYN